MRVMVFVTADENNMAPPAPEAFAAMDRYTDELAAAGILVAGAGLKPTAQSKRIVLQGSEPTVVDGPFSETKEVVAGFSIWEVKNLDEAIAWAKRSPMIGSAGIEIRPFFEAEDLAAFISPEELAVPRTGDRGRLGVA